MLQLNLSISILFNVYKVSMLKKLTFILVIGLILTVQNGLSQASLVPVYHQVYDWMHYQRVRGNAPVYNYEALPLTR